MHDAWTTNHFLLLVKTNKTMQTVVLLALHQQPPLLDVCKWPQLTQQERWYKLKERYVKNRKTGR